MAWVLAVLSCLTIGCHSASENQEVEDLPYYQEASFRPHWLAMDSPVRDTFHRIAPFSLTNQHGEIVDENTVAGKLYVANFFFTVCPGICPKMMENLKIVQEAFAEDEEVLLLSHSVMPAFDSVQVLANYAQRNEIQAEGWHLLTGDRQQIYELGKKAYLVEEDLGEQQASGDFIHTENVLLIDQDRYIRGIYNGLNKTAIQQLIQDIHLLK